MVKHDLEVAGIAYKDAAGRQFDFHALRHTFITRIVKAGVSPKEAQSLARHSTITLTMDRYAHIGLMDIVGDRASAVGRPFVGQRNTGIEGDGN